MVVFVFKEVQYKNINLDFTKLHKQGMKINSHG